MAFLGRNLEWGLAIWKLRIRVRPGFEQDVDGVRVAIPDRQVECGHAIRTRRIQTLLTRRILSLVGEQADDVRMTSVGRQVEWRPAIRSPRIRVPPELEQGFDGSRFAILGCHVECGHAI